MAEGERDYTTDRLISGMRKKHCGEVRVGDNLTTTFWNVDLEIFPEVTSLAMSILNTGSTRRRICAEHMLDSGKS